MDLFADDNVIRLVLPARLSYRAVAIHAVATACPIARGGRHHDGDWDLSSMQSLDLSHAFDADIVTAFGEVFNNIAIHGDADTMEIELRARPGQLDITVRERGAAFDIDAVLPPDLNALPEGGMGLFLARAALDRFEYTAGEPNVWHMVKSIALPSATAHVPDHDHVDRVDHKR